MAPGPIAAVQSTLRALLAQAAQALVSGDPPAPGSVAFSAAGGTGGDLASPYPKILGVDPALLARQIPPHPDLLDCRPSGDWIAFELSAHWWSRARQYRRADLPLDLPPMNPVPAFPARITPESWRFHCLLGPKKPELAARLDRGNPAVLTVLARQKSARGQHPLPQRELAGLALLALEAPEARDMARALYDLSRRYLRSPGEDPLVHRALDQGLSALGISANLPRIP